MKKIIWLRGGLEIPGIGITESGKSVSIPRNQADEFINKGIATDGRLSKKEKEIIGGK